MDTNLITNDQGLSCLKHFTSNSECREFPESLQAMKGIFNYSTQFVQAVGFIEYITLYFDSETLVQSFFFLVSERL